jgi:RimJ/RimL family protein N-acetyltransferase
MIIFNNWDHGHRIMDECQGTFTPGLDVCIGREKDGELLGGVVYTGHTGASCQMHQWGSTPKWINIDMLWVAFHYPFMQLDYRCILGLVRAKNEATIRENLKHGFKEVARVKYVYPGDDLVLMQLLKEDCRWLKLKPRELKFNQELVS